MMSTGKARRRAGAPVIVGVALVAGMLLGLVLAKAGLPGVRYQADEAAETYGLEDRLREIFKYIDYKYVDELDKPQLDEMVIRGFMSGLDPHSAYIPAEDLGAYNEQTEGRYKGIGLEYVVLDDTVRVVGFVGSQSPARAAGLRVGDAILRVDGVELTASKASADSLSGLLRGQSADAVAELEIFRKSENRLLPVRVNREEIELSSVPCSKRVAADVGYIQLTQFNARSYRDFMQAMEGLYGGEKPVRHLVLDLRGNPGGYLDEAVKITSQFFTEKDRLIVYTEGDNSDRKNYMTPGKVFFKVDKLVVLVDESSASGSEILAGAVQDWDRAVLVGRQTFGKALVQEQFGLSDGSAIRLTTSRYYTPVGRMIQRPYKSVRQSLVNPGDSLRSDDAEPERQFFTKIRKRPLRTGRGIYPDVLIPSGRQEKPGLMSETEVLRSAMRRFDAEIQIGDAELPDGDVAVMWELWMRYMGDQQSLVASLDPADKTEILNRLERAYFRLKNPGAEDCQTIETGDEALDVALELMKKDDVFEGL